jgi:hypothetical protein
VSESLQIRIHFPKKSKKKKMGFEKNRLQMSGIIADKNPFSEKNHPKIHQKIP